MDHPLLLCLILPWEGSNSSRIPNLLELKPTNWINQPGGYITVGLSGNIFSEEKRIVGQVTTSGCSGFDVTKVD
jgi:hypothetical protein